MSHPRSFPGTLGGLDGEANLTASLRNLYRSMGESSESFPPFALLSVSTARGYITSVCPSQSSPLPRFSGKSLLSLQK